MIGHPNLKLWLPLNGDSNDASGSGYNGSDTAIAYDAANGKMGQGASLNGTSSLVNLGNVLGFEYNQPWTICAWVKNTGAANSMIVGKQAGSPNYQGFGFNIYSDGYPAVFIYHGSGGYLGVKFPAFYSDALHHLAASYDGSNAASGFKLYADGVQVAGVDVGTMAVSYSILSSANMTVGSQGGGFFWSGLLDDLQIYNAVMSGADIRRIMQGKHPLGKA